MKLRFTSGQKVYKLTDPHAGDARVVTTELRGPANLVLVEWPNERLDWIAEDELRAVSDRFVAAYTYSDRGFKSMEPVKDTYGGQVRVYESSSASGPHIWLAVEGFDGKEGHAHLSLEQAEQIEKQLAWMRANHYQVRT